MIAASMAAVFVALTVWTILRTLAKSGRAELPIELVVFTLACVIGAAFAIREWWTRRN